MAAALLLAVLGVIVGQRLIATIKIVTYEIRTKGNYAVLTKATTESRVSVINLDR